MYGGEENFMQVLVENLRERGRSEDLGEDGRITLRMIYDM